MKKITGGLIVILEGGEGVGKTTQAKELEKYFNSINYSTKYFREPGGNKLAEDIRNLVLYNEMDSITETLLVSAARNINVQDNILPALKDGNIVILDRFYKSTMVYQGILKDADMAFVQDCIIKVVRKLNDSNLYNNSIEFTLLCDPEEAMRRAACEGHERNKNDILPIEDYKKINDAYKYLFYSYPNKFVFEYHTIHEIIDTTNISQDTVFNKLINGIQNVINKCEVYEE